MKVLSCFSDVCLCHLIQDLKLIQKLALVSDERLLIIQLLVELAEVEILFSPLYLNRSLEVALLFLTLLDDKLLSLNFHPE